MDPSNRIRLDGYALLPAFTSIGFDQLVMGTNRLEPGKNLLKDMVTIKWMCKLGRPLYVPE